MTKTKSYSAYVIQRSCLRKKGYSLKQADDFITKSAKEGKCLLYYKCAFCNQYHLTKAKTLVDSEYFVQVI